MSALILRGDARALPLPDCSVDVVICDPPYGLEFMGQEWDSFRPSSSRIRTRIDGRTNPAEGRSTTSTPEAYVAGRPFQDWCEQWAREALRVLKPGGHLLAFGGTRTWHRLVCGIEDAGFEIRDSIAWLYGQGFPKSLDVGRVADGWQGWGTALKPGFEPIAVARKPLSGTVAANVTAYGTGALNIDACRIPSGEPDGRTREREGETSVDRIYAEPAGFTMTPGPRGGDASGRWPTNVLLDDATADELDAQSGILTSGVLAPHHNAKPSNNASMSGPNYAGRIKNTFGGDSGGASRFFPVFRYEAKAPTDERPVVDGVAHPTVKPLALMRWLVKLVTPPGGLVLDFCAGSGTTVEAAIMEGFPVIGIELNPKYHPLIAYRVARARRRLQPGIARLAKSKPVTSAMPSLFDELTEDGAAA